MICLIFIHSFFDLIHLFPFLESQISPILQALVPSTQQLPLYTGKHLYPAGVLQQVESSKHSKSPFSPQWVFDITGEKIAKIKKITI